jgi:hypothetical protein
VVDHGDAKDWLQIHALGMYRFSNANFSFERDDNGYRYGRYGLYGDFLRGLHVRRDRGSVRRGNGLQN